MFGVVRPVMDKLEQEDKNIFNSYYCGVCKSMARRSSSLSRMALSFDCTFLALFLSAVNNETGNTKSFRCVGRKREMGISSVIDYCGDINIILTYYKLMDDVNDDKSIKAKVAAGALRTGYKKAQTQNSAVDKMICANLDYLYDLEKDKCDNPDMVADAFGRLLEGVVGIGCHMQGQARAVGYNLGKYIYLIDAFMDYDKDIKSGSYNVFYEKYGIISDLRDKVTFLFECTLSDMAAHYNNLQININKNILDNILYLGIIQPLLMDTKDKEQSA